jgi:hypothetical protein
VNLEIVSPDQVIAKLNELIQTGEKGINALYDAEIKVADKDLVYEKAYQSAFLEAQGTVADRTAVARLKTADLQFELDLAKVELNRVKAKIKQISDAGTLTAVIAKQVELTFRHG